MFSAPGPIISLPIQPPGVGISQCLALLEIAWEKLVMILYIGFSSFFNL